MHACDRPEEALLRLSGQADMQLMMPRLGEPTEPAHADDVVPWWRSVDTIAATPAPYAPEPITLPKSMPWLID